MRCAECGAETTETTEFCVLCGAPAIGQRPVAADPSASRPNNDVATVPAAARDPWSPPAWIRRGRAYFWTALVFCLAVYLAGVVAGNKTPKRGELHSASGWLILFGLAGALLSLILIEVARRPHDMFDGRQVAWTLVPIVSFGLLAPLPFLWLALIRRRARDWLVFAAYLAAAVGAYYFLAHPSDAVYSNANVMIEGLVVIASAHIVLAFSPAAGASTWSEARAARVAANGQQPVVSTVPPAVWQQDADADQLKPIVTDSGGPDAK